MATTQDISLPTGWASYAPEQKIDYFNANNVSASQLGAAGVSAGDIAWMQGHGYTGGTPAAPTAAAASVAPASAGIAGLPATSAAASATPFSTAALPPAWNTYDPNQKIEFFNNNLITAPTLANAGVSASDLAWMRDHGYTGVKTYGTDEKITSDQLRNYVDTAMGAAQTGTVPQAFSVLDYAKNYGVDVNELQRILDPKAYGALSSQISTRLSSGLGDIIADKKLTFDEAANALNSLRYYGLTDDQSAAFLGKQASAVKAMRGVFDSGLGKIVGGMTADKNITTDEAKGILSAAKQFGLSDADLAKYTGGTYTEQQLADYFNPVRNFGTSVNAILKDTSLTPEQVRQKLSDLSANPLAAEMYADPLKKLESDLDTLGQKWTGATGWQLNKNVPVKNPLVAEGLYKQLDSIHDAVAGHVGREYWQGEGYGGVDRNMQAFTGRLLEKGVTNLGQLDVREVPVEGTDQVVKQLINKDTGAVVGEQRGGDNTFRVGYTTQGEGMVHYNLVMKPTTDPATGVTRYTPIPVQQYEDTSDIKNIAPALALASFIPGVAPFAMAANAGLAASQGNWAGALLSGIGAAPGLSAAAGMPMAAETAKTLGTVSSGLRAANALSKGDYLGALTATGNLVNDGDWTVPGTQGMLGESGLKLSDLGKGLGALGAISQGQILPGVLAGADLAGVKDIAGTGIAPKDIAQAASVLQALQGGDPTKIINTVGRAGQQYGVIPKAAGGLASLVG